MAPTEFRIAFGSCAHEDEPQPMLDIAVEQRPDVFIYLGDNIYGDSYEMDTLRAKYARLAAKPEFQRLGAAMPVLAVWDDHDYGWNDSGRHYPFKELSKEIFMDFWGVPADNDRRKHPGIYGVEWLEKDDYRIQLILLDTRTFRDDLHFRDTTDQRWKNDYMPNIYADSTFLGEAQWTWLERQLQQNADARIIASSNQFSHEYNGWESWTNVPWERERMIELIASTKANGVIFISGDVHWGEISRLETAGCYPLYDVTSSGITSTWDSVEPNANRVGPVIRQNNIGLIRLLLNEDEATVELGLIDSSGLIVAETEFGLEALRMP